MLGMFGLGCFNLLVAKATFGVAVMIDQRNMARANSSYRRHIRCSQTGGGSLACRRPGRGCTSATAEEAAGRGIRFHTLRSGYKGISSAQTAIGSGVAAIRQFVVLITGAVSDSSELPMIGPP